MSWNTHIPKFRRFVLQNFPFIEEDFDALTDYQLICKVVEYLNKVIDSQNGLVNEVERLENLFVELKSFVDNYFDNLDVQEEINNKLDAMVEAGTLQEIITQYIQANVAWTFDTVNDMKNATNLVNGSYARTLGFRSINDGGGATYYITNSGTANEMDVISVGDLFANLVKPLTVTPEMFGAYGDGTHDDSDAWNRAVSVGRNVKAFEKTYLVSTIEVSDNIDIDCGNASFICSTTRLFIISGEVVTSLANENDYDADDIDYTITNTDYTSYSGFAFLHGSNNFEESREYYRGGFACTFSNGKITTSYPIPVVDTVIDIINPVKGSMKNVKNITHQTLTDANRSIVIKYAEGYVIDNFHGKGLQAYIDIDIEKSINVTCRNLNITHDVTLSDDVSYIVMFEDSSYCNITDSYLFNRKWHCWTTSGIYLCYSNRVTNCTMFTDSPYAILDHDNALGTTVENVTSTNVGVSGLSYVNNVKIHSCKDAQKRCNVAIFSPSIAKNSKFVITNVYIDMDASANGTYCGIFINKAPQVTGKSYTYTDIYIDNVKTNKTQLARTYFANLPNTSNFTIGKVTVKNSTLEVVFPTTSHTHINTATSEVLVDGDNDYVINKYGDIGNSNAKFNKLIVTNSHIRQLSGLCTTLVVDNLEMENTSSGFSATNIYGSNLLKRIDFSVLSNATIVNISNMQYNATTQQFNFVKADGTVYYQQVNTSTGLFETKTIA